MSQLKRLLMFSKVQFAQFMEKYSTLLFWAILTVTPRESQSKEQLSGQNIIKLFLLLLFNFLHTTFSVLCSVFYFRFFLLFLSSLHLQHSNSLRKILLVMSFNSCSWFNRVGGNRNRGRSDIKNYSEIHGKWNFLNLTT